MTALVPPAVEAPPRWILARVATLMALQYASLGAWSVTISTYIAAHTGELGRGLFNESFVGWYASAGAIGALVSPVAMGVIADRWVSVDRLLAWLHLGCGLSLAGLLACGAWGTQGVFYALLLAYFQAFVPTGALASSLAFRRLPRPDTQFAQARAAGTAGWVVAGAWVGFGHPRLFGNSIEATLTPVALGAALHLVTAAYALTLPRTLPDRGVVSPTERFKGSGALSHSPAFWGFLLVSVIATASPQFYNYYINLYLNESGYQSAALKATIAQVSEVFAILLLPALLTRRGIRPLFLAGVIAWAVRFALLAYAEPLGAPWMVYLAIGMHGVSFPFVYIAGQYYVDRLAPRHARSAAQGFLSLATSGLGHLGGATLTGFAQAWWLTPEGVSPPPYDWTRFWLLACTISVVAAGLFVALHAEAPKEPPPPEAEGESPDGAARPAATELPA